MSSLLLATIVFPLAGAAMLTGSNARARQSALVSTLLVLGMSGWIVFHYPGGGDFAAFEYRWLGADSPIDIRLSMALDGLGVWLFGLTALLSVVAVLVSWRAIEHEARSYYRLLLLLETGMLGVFAARDIILFYIFFEFTLIPLFFLIGVWGSEERRHAAVKFFLFTMAGGMLTFLSLLALVLWAAQFGPMTFSIPALTVRLAVAPPPLAMQTAIFLGLFAGFAIKVPLFPLHTWLPLAHVQAPTAGSVLLAGVLLKIGGYGFARFAVPMLPSAVALLMPGLLWLSVAGILYGAMVALAQSDIKRLIAYSSVSHLGFCMLGIFCLNRVGMQGAVLQMVNHGLSTGGLFAVVGMIYERYHTRQIRDLGGLAHRTPRLAAMMLLLTFSSIGLPGLNGFAGEFMILLGMFHRAWGDPPAQFAGQLRVIAVLATLGVVLGAWYMLQLVQRVFFGPLREPAEAAEHPVEDLNTRETLALAPLLVFIVWIGIWPGFFLDRMSGTLDRILLQAENVVETDQPWNPTTASLPLSQARSPMP